MIPTFSLGDRLRKARVERHLEQAQLADMLRVDRSTVVRYEADALKRVDGDLVEKWARATDVPFWWFEKGLEPLPPAGEVRGSGRWRLPRLDSNQQPAGYGTWHARPAASVHDLASKRKRVAEVRSAPRVRRHGDQAAA